MALLENVKKKIIPGLILSLIHIYILNFVNGCASLREKRLPVKLGYAIKKNLAAVSDAANAYDAERQELLEKYAAKGEDGKFLVENGQYSIEDKEGFAKDLDELLAIEIEVGIHTVSEEEIEKCDDPRYDALTAVSYTHLDVYKRQSWHRTKGSSVS